MGRLSKTECTYLPTYLSNLWTLASINDSPFRYGLTLIHQTNKPLGLQDSLLQAVW